MLGDDDPSSYVVLTFNMENFVANVESHTGVKSERHEFRRKSAIVGAFCQQVCNMKEQMKN